MLLFVVSLALAVLSSLAAPASPPTPSFSFSPPICTPVGPQAGSANGVVTGDVLCVTAWGPITPRSFVTAPNLETGGKINITIPNDPLGDPTSPLSMANTENIEILGGGLSSLFQDTRFSGYVLVYTSSYLAIAYNRSMKAAPGGANVVFGNAQMGSRVVTLKNAPPIGGTISGIFDKMFGRYALDTL